ncbi:hypothetical protein BST61_g10719 [Cercospora zeina]
MGLHQRHTHGRVFRGDDAREQLMIRKRDLRDDNPRMHVPDDFDNSQSQDSGAPSVVYVTLPQTFDGPAVYSTLTGEYNPDATVPAQATDAADGGPNFYTGPPESATRTRAAPTSTLVPISSQPHTTLETATSSGGRYVGGTPIQATSAATSSPATADTSSEEMTGGAKAGLAFGIIAIVACAAGLAYFCWRRKKPIKANTTMNEKHGSFADVGARRAEANGTSGRNLSGGMSGGMNPVAFAPAPSTAMAAGATAGATAGVAAAAAHKRDSTSTDRSTRTTSTAPRLSLRPVTQFLPTLGENKTNAPANDNEKRNSEANNGADPFADTTALSEKQASPDSPPANPFDEQRRSRESSSGAAAAAVGAAAAAAAGADGKRDSEPSTPRSAHSTHSGPPGSAGGPPPPRQPNNVHRVQLDFKPSMDDELELISGALVRLLHEYDDGWALCITMDRSKQGVAPRTCLSKLPVKPRPQGPPPPGGWRPSTPNGQQRGPPPNGPPRGPMGPPGAMQPRPLTPQSARSQSPNEERPMTARSNGPASPPTSSQVPSRKPVPGQAM